MFARKRVYRNKLERETVGYHLFQSYRENGCVKHRVITNLAGFLTLWDELDYVRKQNGSINTTTLQKEVKKSQGMTRIWGM
jgi:hypothetical protein